MARSLLDLGVTQSELGSMVGGSRRSVNQILRALSVRGFLELDGKTVTVMIPLALRRRAGTSLTNLTPGSPTASSIGKIRYRTKSGRRIRLAPAPALLVAASALVIVLVAVQRGGSTSGSTTGVSPAAIHPAVFVPARGGTVIVPKTVVLSNGRICARCAP